MKIDNDKANDNKKNKNDNDNNSNNTKNIRNPIVIKIQITAWKIILENQWNKIWIRKTGQF